MVEFILHEKNNRSRLRVKMTEQEAEQFQLEADKLGMSVKEMLELDLRIHAAKMKAEGRL